MKRRDIKSSCPINFTLEIFGDPWSLLIIRGMLNSGKRTFGEFMQADERIGTSVLTDRLTHLEKHQIISKHPDPADKRKSIYSLTEAGLGVIPVLYEVAVWGSNTSANPKAAKAWFRAMELDRNVVIAAWEKAARSGSSFMTGENSVVAQLKLEGE